MSTTNIVSKFKKIIRCLRLDEVQSDEVAETHAEVIMNKMN